MRARLTVLAACLGWATVALAAPVGPLTVTLNPGWNSVALQAAQLTAVSANPAVAGVAWWDGTSYQSRNLTVTDLNASGGGRRGYWVYATSATSFTYSATDDSLGNRVVLLSGYNLVSFANSADFSASSLTASVNGTVLPTYYEIGPGNTYTAVDAATGTIRAGRAYWIYAAAPVTLTYGGTPAPLPSVAPRTLQVTQLAPYQVGSSRFTANTTLDLNVTIAPALTLTGVGTYSATAAGSPGFSVACAAAGSLGPGTGNFTTLTGTVNPLTRTGTVTILGAYPATVTPTGGSAQTTRMNVNATFNVRLEADSSVTIVLPPTAAPANSTTGVNPTNFRP